MLRWAATVMLSSTSSIAWAAADSPLPNSGYQIIAGLIFVTLLITACAWFARRFGRISIAPSKLRILAGMPVGTRERIVLVQVGDTQLLLGVSPGRVQTLHVLEHPLQDELREAPEENAFAQRLAALFKANVVNNEVKP